MPRSKGNEFVPITQHVHLQIVSKLTRRIVFKSTRRKEGNNLNVGLGDEVAGHAQFVAPDGVAEDGVCPDKVPTLEDRHLVLGVDVCSPTTRRSQPNCTKAVG